MNLKNQSNASFSLKKKYLRYIVALLTLTCILLFSYYLKNNNYSIEHRKLIKVQYKNMCEYALNDKVLYKEYSGTTIKVDDEEYIVIKDEDIIAVSK